MRRRTFLAVLGAAVATACRGAAEPSRAVVTTTSTPPPATGDGALLDQMLGMEDEAVAAYERLLGNPALDGAAQGVATAFAGHHRDHAAALREAMSLAGYATRSTGGGAIPMPEADADLVLHLAGIEDRLAATYLVTCGRLQTAEVAQAIAGILGVEARHAAVLRAMGGETAVPAPFLDEQVSA